MKVQVENERDGKATIYTQAEAHNLGGYNCDQTEIVYVRVRWNGTVMKSKTRQFRTLSETRTAQIRADEEAARLAKIFEERGISHV